MSTSEIDRPPAPGDTPPSVTKIPLWPQIRPFVLRLHFYAGILVGPFLLIAAVTGLLYTIRINRIRSASSSAASGRTDSRRCPKSSLDDSVGSSLLPVDEVIASPFLDIAEDRRCGAAVRSRLHRRVDRRDRCRRGAGEMRAAGTVAPGFAGGFLRVVGDLAHLRDHRKQCALIDVRPTLFAETGDSSSVLPQCHRGM